MMATDRREYMRNYRAAKKAKLQPHASVTVLHEQHEQTNTAENVPQPVSCYGDVLRTGEHLEEQGVHVVTQNVTETVRNSTNGVREPARTVRNPPAVTVFPRPLSTYAATAALVCFIAANTAFLVREQVAFYDMNGDGRGYGWFVACLTESAALFLSFFGTWYRRPAVMLLMLPTLALIFLVIFLGLERKSAKDEVLKRDVTLLEEELAALKAQAETIDPKSMPTALRRVQERIEEKHAELRRLPVATSSSKELWVMAALRVLSICWNIAFASLVAFIWKGGSMVSLFPKPTIGE